MTFRDRHDRMQNYWHRLDPTKNHHVGKARQLCVYGWRGIAVNFVSSQDLKAITQWLKTEAQGQYWRTGRVYNNNGLEVWFRNQADLYNFEIMLRVHSSYPTVLLRYVSEDAIERMKPWLRKIRHGIFYEISRTTYAVRMEDSLEAVAARGVALPFSSAEHPERRPNSRIGHPSP